MMVKKVKNALKLAQKDKIFTQPNMIIYSPIESPSQI
jgi:hypothetical protein